MPKPDPQRCGTGENGNCEHIGFSFSKEEGRREAQGDTERASGWRGLCHAPRPAPLLDDPAWVNAAFTTISRLGTWKARASLSKAAGHSRAGMAGCRAQQTGHGTTAILSPTLAWNSVGGTDTLTWGWGLLH